MTNLHRLHLDAGQSPWLDNLTRELITGGGLHRLVTAGVRGVTADPMTMARAIAGSAAYDAQLHTLARVGRSVEDIYWEMVIDDVTAALDVLHRLHSDSGGDDGFVSLALAPALAFDAEASVDAAARLHARIDRPNLLVEVPAAGAGIEAIRAATAVGLSTNVTLIFSLDRYAQVIDAYLSGLEAFVAAGGDPATVHSVASFFISRVDAEVDRRLAERGVAGDGLRGTVGIAQAKLAYRMFTEALATERWAALAALGAHEQRPLWASTSTEDPALPDTLYVDQLVGPRTVTTLPEVTIAAFDDHGTVRRSIDVDLEGARATLAAAEAAGVDLVDLGLTLEDHGIASSGWAFEGVFETMCERLHDEFGSGDAHAA